MMARSRKRWEFTVRSDDHKPLLVTAVQQYVGMPQYGLVVGVYQRTTGSGHGLLLPPKNVGELRDELADWLADDVAGPPAWTVVAPDQKYPNKLHLSTDSEGLLAQAEHDVSGAYTTYTPTVLLTRDSVVQWRDALTSWLDTEIDHR